jgi:hypothetical protein
VPVTGTSNVTCFRCRHPPSYDCHRDLLERLQGTVRFQQDRYLCFDEGLTIRRRAFFRGNGVRPQPDNGTVIEADAPRLPVVRAARASCCLRAARGQIRAWMAATRRLLAAAPGPSRSSLIATRPLAKRPVLGAREIKGSEYRPM